MGNTLSKCRIEYETRECMICWEEIDDYELHCLCCHISLHELCSNKYKKDICPHCQKRSLKYY